MNLSIKIEEAIRTTLVVENKESIYRAVCKIIRVIQENPKSTLDVNQHENDKEIAYALSIWAAKRLFPNYKSSIDNNEYNPDFGIKELQGDRRFKPYSMARHLFMYLLYTQFGNGIHTYSTIANELNLKNHSAVSHAKKNFMNDYETDKEFRKVADEVIEKVKQFKNEV